MKKNILSFVVAFICKMTFAQITTSVNPTIAQIQTLLQGSGISISSMSLTCPSGAYATFNNGSSALGGSLNSGILLTTGSAANVAGPNTSSNNLSYDASAPGSSLGNALSGGTTYDGCYIDFILTPSCSTLSLNYVFASEEYPEFTTGTINDVFGFVISGPNPAGGNFNQTNIATIPGTTTPVSIQSVNNGTANTGPCLNCAYYIANPPNLAYDAATTVLTASIAVTPCQQYTMTLGIWDESDGIYDSGVFLDFNGVACNGSANSLNASVTSNTLCTAQSITLTASGGFTSSTYTWSSSALGNLVSTSGATVVANPTGTSSYTLSYQDSSTCIGVPIQKVIDVNFVTPTFSVTSSLANPLCAGQSTSLTATAGAGNYTWTPSVYLSANNVASVVSTPAASVIYTVSFQDMSGCASTSTVDVQVSICTGLQSISDSNKSIIVFPNPVNSHLYFNSEFNITEVKVFNQNGQQLQLPIGSDYINCAQLNNGVYTIEFKIGQTSIHKRFVKID